MKTARRVFAVDTNVLLRYLTKDDEDLWAKAYAVIKAMHDGEITLFCDPIILAETVFVMQSVYQMPKQKIEETLDPLLKAEGFEVPGKDRYVRALGIYAATNAHFGDACACAAAIEDCDGRLLSFDKKLSAIEGIERMESPDFT